MNLVYTLYQGCKTQLQAKGLSEQLGRYLWRVTAQTARCIVLFFKFLYFFSGSFFPPTKWSRGRYLGVGSRNCLDQLLSRFKWVTLFIFYKNMLGKAGEGRGGLIIVSQWKWLTYLRRGEKVQLQDLELCTYWPGVREHAACLRMGWTFCPQKNTRGHLLYYKQSRTPPSLPSSYHPRVCLQPKSNESLEPLREGSD